VVKKVTSFKQAYNIMTAPMRLHKFGTSYNAAVAFVLAESEQDAEKLIKAQMPKVDWPTLTYLGAKELHELKPCVMLNQFPVF